MPYSASAVCYIERVHGVEQRAGLWDADAATALRRGTLASSVDVCDFQQMPLLARSLVYRAKQRASNRRE